MIVKNAYPERNRAGTNHKEGLTNPRTDWGLGRGTTHPIAAKHQPNNP